MTALAFLALPIALLLAAALASKVSDVFCS